MDEAPVLGVSAENVAGLPKDCRLGCFRTGSSSSLPVKSMMSSAGRLLDVDFDGAREASRVEGVGVRKASGFFKAEGCG